MADKKHALYLADPKSKRVELVHADNLEDKRKAGWKEPEGQKANGADWNADDDLPGQDYAAEFEKEKAEADAEKAKKSDAERQKAERAKPDPIEIPDLKVQVVEPPKPKKAGK